MTTFGERVWQEYDESVDDREFIYRILGTSVDELERMKLNDGVDFNPPDREIEDVLETLARN